MNQIEQIKENVIQYRISQEVEYVLRGKALEVLSDPRFFGSWKEAVEIASETFFGVQPDPNAMRRQV